MAIYGIDGTTKQRQPVASEARTNTIESWKTSAETRIQTLENYAANAITLSPNANVLKLGSNVRMWVSRVLATTPSTYPSGSYIDFLCNLGDDWAAAYEETIGDPEFRFICFAQTQELNSNLEMVMAHPLPSGVGIDYLTRAEIAQGIAISFNLFVFEYLDR